MGVGTGSNNILVWPEVQQFVPTLYSTKGARLTATIATATNTTLQLGSSGVYAIIFLSAAAGRDVINISAGQNANTTPHITVIMEGSSGREMLVSVSEPNTILNFYQASGSNVTTYVWKVEK